MNDYERYILDCIRRAGPIDIKRFDADSNPFVTPQWDAVKALGIAGYVSWPEHSPFVSITPTGLAALKPVEITWPGLTAEEMERQVAA